MGMRHATAWAVRQLVCSGMVVIAHTALPEDAAAETFQAGFAGAMPSSTGPATRCSKVVVGGQSIRDAVDGGGTGLLRRRGGGPAAVSCARTAKAEESFEVSASVSCPPEAKGRDCTLTGAFRLHTDNGGTEPNEGSFCRLVCDHRFGGPGLSHVGANIGRQPLERERGPIEQTAPATDGGGAGRAPTSRRVRSSSVSTTSS